MKEGYGVTTTTGCHRGRRQAPAHGVDDAGRCAGFVGVDRRGARGPQIIALRASDPRVVREVVEFGTVPPGLTMGVGLTPGRGRRTARASPAGEQRRRRVTRPNLIASAAA